MRRVMKTAVLFFALTTLCASGAGCNSGARGGMPDYCYVMSYSPQFIPKQFFQLHGHRKWTPDVLMGTFESIDDAKVAAAKVECPFRY